VGTPTLTVSMPTWRTPQLRRAVESVLNQTFTDLRLVVVNDGDDPWHLLDGIDDPRLVRFDLKANRGRYWCDAVTLAACGSEWWTPHDADDVSEPDRYEAQLVGDVSFTSVMIHGLDGTVTTHPIRPGNPIAKYPAGVYRTAVAREVGIHPLFRVGYDTVFVRRMWERFDPVVVNRGLYHVHRRSDSLTTSAETGRGSRLRLEHRRRARELLRRPSECPQPSALLDDVARLREVL